MPGHHLLLPRAAGDAEAELAEGAARLAVALEPTEGAGARRDAELQRLRWTLGHQVDDAAERIGSIDADGSVPW